MNDKQQLAAMGEHMREVEECKPEFKVPDGWRLVPETPSNEMVNSVKHLMSFSNPVGAYKLMIAAAPECKP